MDWATFERSLLHVAHYCAQGTQEELSLTGIGEALLNPLFKEMVIRSREVIGANRKLVMATNGTEVTDDIAQFLAKWGVTTYVSLHRPEVAGPAIHKLRKAGVCVGTNDQFVTASYNWIGEVDWPHTDRKAWCSYLGKGWGVVRVDGAVNTCCWDAHGSQPIGHVINAVGSLVTHVTPLCEKCPLVVPPFMLEQQEAG